MHTARPAVRGLWTVGLIAFFFVAVAAPLVEGALKGKPASLASLASIPSVLGLYFLLFALPSGFPALLIGLSLAARLLRRARRESLVIWSLRGLAAGTLLGPLGVCCWFGLLNIATPADLVAQLAELATAGAACGAAVGLPVGVQCWRASRLLAPPPLPC